ncbi:MAG: PLP-dependent cysteine synthase family protein [Micrococcaceae bacterium]
MRTKNKAARHVGHTPECRGWTSRAIEMIEQDKPAEETPLRRIKLNDEFNVNLYLKDESVHATGSLKHRLARSLFIYGLVNGWIEKGTAIVEASSGSTAVSEAYYAALLGLPFIAVVPKSTSQEKVALIEQHGGQVHFVNTPSEVYEVAEQLAEENHGHFMNQFKYAERATDWRGNHNIAHAIFDQIQDVEKEYPEWVVAAAGTGGTSATIGRYARYLGLPTRLCVVDPENSSFYPAWMNKDISISTQQASRIEGIGRPQVEESFIPGVIDTMIKVPDAASIAAMRYLHEAAGIYAGPSTGTNLWGVVNLAEHMKFRGRPGSIISLICDGGERYEDTYYNDSWLAENNIDITPFLDYLRKTEFIKELS